MTNKLFKQKGIAQKSLAQNDFAKRGLAQSGFTQRGFTLIELAIVLTVMGLLYIGATPIVSNMIIRARESVLKENLRQIREAIDCYYADRNEWPRVLEDLVEHKYLRRIPVDPFTQSDQTWDTIPYEPTAEEFEAGLSVDGIYDVRSSADGHGLDGSPYSDW